MTLETRATLNKSKVPEPIYTESRLKPPTLHSVVDESGSGPTQRVVALAPCDIRGTKTTDTLYCRISGPEAESFSVDFTLTDGENLKDI